ncbi:MAG: aminopeptidase N C-terminal domain-containing protein, partial [Parachlamydiaceae bacterium]
KDTSALVAVYQSLLTSEQTPIAEKAELLKFPELSVFYDVVSPVDVTALAEAVKSLLLALIPALREDLLAGLAVKPSHAEDDLSFAAMSERALQNSLLQLLVKSEDESVVEFADNLFAKATTMNAKMSALTALNQFSGEVRENALNAFYEQFKDDPQVVDKWLSLEASANVEGVIERIKALSKHPAFSFTTPNKVRSLYSVFCMRNPEQFHRFDGKGYQLLSDLIYKLDDINPSTSARLVSPLTQWRKFDDKRAGLMCEKLKQLLSKPNLSKDVYVIVSKSLG